jgi:hypothetical protein
MPWTKPRLPHEFGLRQVSIGLGLSLFMTASGMLFLSHTFLDRLFAWMRSLDVTQFQILVESLIKLQMVTGLLLMIAGAVMTLRYARGKRKDSDPKSTPVSS